MEEKNSKLEELDKKFKMIENLNDIRLDIRELKREVFQENGETKWSDKSIVRFNKNSSDNHNRIYNNKGASNSNLI